MHHNWGARARSGFLNTRPLHFQRVFMRTRAVLQPVWWHKLLPNLSALLESPRVTNLSALQLGFKARFLMLLLHWTHLSCLLMEEKVSLWPTAVGDVELVGSHDRFGRCCRNLDCVYFWPKRSLVLLVSWRQYMTHGIILTLTIWLSLTSLYFSFHKLVHLFPLSSITRRWILTISNFGVRVELRINGFSYTLRRGFNRWFQVARPCTLWG